MKNTYGFTLIELTISLAVISIGIISIIVASSLIKQSEIRAVIKEASLIEGIVAAFQAQYNSLPGDMSDASFRIDGSAVNGDGDGGIIYNTEAGDNEGLQAWLHLSLANLIDRQFTGSGGSAIIGTNVLQSELENANTGYYFDFVDDSNWYNSNVNLFILGRDDNTNMNDASALSPTNALNIDTKIDDGIPNEGDVIANFGSAGSIGDCVNRTLPMQYVASDSDELLCVIGFKIAID
ncbi:MAG: prepilin-type N-terminal cleavage/methylation domain-containing protein [Pseudomonadota bacterium]